MTTKKVSAKISPSLLERLEDSREKMSVSRGAKPTFAAWITEAIAEKLNREDEMSKK